MMKRRILDTVAAVTNTVALSVNFLFFLPMLIEQLETGWGFPTRFEMMILLFWTVQALTLPFILFGIVYAVIASFREIKDKWYVTNIAMTFTATAFLVLSVVFSFC